MIKIKKIILLTMCMALLGLNANAMQKEENDKKTISLETIYEKPQILEMDIQKFKNTIESYSKNLEDKILKNKENIYILKEIDGKEFNDNFENKEKQIIMYHIDEMIEEFKKLNFLDKYDNIKLTSNEKKDMQLDFIVFSNIFKYLANFRGWLKDVENEIEKEKNNKIELSISTTKIILDKFNEIKSKMFNLFMKFQENKKIKSNSKLYKLINQIYKDVNNILIPSIENSIHNLKDKQKILKFDNNSKTSVIDFWESLEYKIIDTLKIIEKIYNNYSTDFINFNKITKKPTTLINNSNAAKKNYENSNATAICIEYSQNDDLKALLDFLNTTKKALNNLDILCKEYADLEKNTSSNVKKNYDNVCMLYPYMLNIIKHMIDNTKKFLYVIHNPLAEYEITPMDFVDSYFQYKANVLNSEPSATTYLIDEEQNKIKKELTYDDYIDLFNCNIKNLVHSTNYNSLKLIENPLSTKEKTKAYFDLIKKYKDSKPKIFNLEENLKQYIDISNTDKINEIEELMLIIDQNIDKIFKYSDFIDKSIFKNDFNKSTKNENCFSFHPTSHEIYKLENCLLNLALTYEQTRNLLKLIKILDCEGIRDKTLEDKILNQQCEKYFKVHKYFKHRLNKIKDFLLKKIKKFDFVEIKNNKNKKSKKKSKNDKLVDIIKKSFYEQTDEYNNTKTAEKIQVVKDKLYFYKFLTENVAFYFDSYYKNVPKYIKENPFFEIVEHVLNIENDRLNTFFDIIDEDQLKNSCFFGTHKIKHNIYEYKKMLKDFKDGLNKIKEKNETFNKYYESDYQNNYNYYLEKIKLPFNINQKNNSISVREQKKYLQYLYAYLINIVYNKDIFKKEKTEININKSFFDYVMKPNEYFNLINSYINEENTTTYIENPLFKKELFENVNKFKTKLNQPIEFLNNENIIKFEEDFNNILINNFNSFYDILEKIALISKEIYDYIYEDTKNFDKEIYSFVVRITRFLGYSKTLLINLKTYIEKNKNIFFYKTKNSIKLHYTKKESKEFKNNYKLMCNFHTLINYTYLAYKKLKEKMHYFLTKNDKNIPNFNAILRKYDLNKLFKTYDYNSNKNLLEEKISVDIKNKFDDEYFDNFKSPIEFKKYEKSYKFLNDYIFKKKFLLTDNHIKEIQPKFPDITNLFILFKDQLQHLTFSSFDFLNFLTFFEKSNYKNYKEDEKENEYEEIEEDKI